MIGKKVTRQGFWGATAGGLAVSALTSPLDAQLASPKPGTLRDRWWLFGSPTGSTIPPTGCRTVMGPAEGPRYLGVPNIYMNQANTVLDVGLPSAEFARNWIAKVGSQTV